MHKFSATILLMGLLCALQSVQGQEPDSELLTELFKRAPKEFRKIIRGKEEYQLQVIYSQINRDAEGNPSFTSHYFNFDHDRYFYPASTVKMPVAFLSLERMNELGLARQLFMLTDSVFSGQSKVTADTTSASGMPSVEHYIKKIFVVSDNDGYNRLYEFLGPGYIMTSLQDKGYTDTRIIHRLSIPLSEEENRHTNPVRFTDGTGRQIYDQPANNYAGELNLKGEVRMGKGFIRNEELVSEPMDFTRKNFFPLDEMQQMLQAIIFPEHSPAKSRFNMTEDQRQFVLRYMSQLPGETDWPQYEAPEYFDAYSKFLLYGSDKNVEIPGNIRIFNKIGQAYGFVIDNAYIIDFERNVEFFLSAVIRSNKNEIYNDGEYEYEEIAMPFMRDLGRVIYDYELKRSREHAPDLSEFRLTYDRN